MAGTVLSQGQVHILRQAQHFRKVLYKFRSRRSTFARSGTDFMAGEVLSQGQVRSSGQVQHFRKVRLFRGPPPSPMKLEEDRRGHDSARGALISVNILKTSRGLGGASTKGDDDRRSDVSTKGGDDRRSDDSTEGALSSAKQTSRQPPP